MLSDRQLNAGLTLGLLQGIVPGAAALDATQRAAGVGPVGSPRFERSKFVGQILGGALMTVIGGAGMTGGGALILSQVGAAIGIPATSMSFGLAAAGVANTLAGWQGLWQSLATGGSAGPPGVSAGPAAPVKPQGQVHHAISKKVWEALEKHEKVKGKYNYRDSRFESRGSSPDAHRGYWGWHSELDDEIVQWIQKQDDLTPEKFEKYLHWRYAQPDLTWRFPSGIQPNVK